MYWICGHLSGGLGNRLFQHVAALGLAEKWNRECIFYLPQCSKTDHGAFGNIFSLFPDTRIVSEDESFQSLSEPPGHVFTYTSFDEHPIECNISVDGWRQSPLYFPKKSFDISLENALEKSKQEMLLKKYNLDTNEKKSVSWFLHIRLGDYKILPHHQIDIGTYILNAVKHIPKNTPFLLFSDEATAYKQMLQDFCKAIGIQATIVENDDELESLFLMSSCWGGAIVANSTFSWWGAYLARQRCIKKETYIAFYPDIWGSGLPPARDIVPDWGTKISWK